MKPDLSIACNEFQIACIQKLEKKEREGFKGWDNPKFKADLMHKLWEHCVEYVGKYRDEEEDRKANKDNLVDIANFCNFLWNLEDRVGDDNV